MRYISTRSQTRAALAGAERNPSPHQSDSALERNSNNNRAESLAPAAPVEHSEPLSFTDAVLTGLAADGGLLIPERIPNVANKLGSWRRLSYVSLAFEIFKEFVGDIPQDDLKQLIDRSYTRFDCDDVVRLQPLAEETVLELFHGPTLAFKDIALQFLGNVFEYVLRQRQQQLNILGATSGDTGSAAIEGVRGRSGIRIFIMYPLGRTSRLQEIQMTTVADANVFNMAIEGSFDDCQGIMKEIFNDLEFKAQFQLGAVNSVNWARVLAQVVYYFYAALRVSEPGTPVAFSVPTGNFGDIFAGYVAAKMGLPIAKLLLATNENDILSRFFNDGIYRRGDVRQTISPSMDIQVASNFERYLFYLLGGDSNRVLAFLKEFNERGESRLPLPVDDGLFLATAVDKQETLATIRSVYQRDRYVLDPHSAVGVAAARRLHLSAVAPVISLATAHPAKFPEALSTVVLPEAAQHPRLDVLVGKSTRRVVLPANVDRVKQYLREVIGA